VEPRTGRQRRLQLHRGSGSLRGGSARGLEVAADAIDVTVRKVSMVAVRRNHRWRHDGLGGCGGRHWL
jgi:hypothetical protein